MAERSGEGLGEHGVRLAENALAVYRLGGAAWEELLRTLRLPARRDVGRLMRQVARTEDKLERVLSEVEALEEALGGGEERPRTGRGGRARSTERIRPETGPTGKRAAQPSEAKGRGSDGSD